MKIAIIGYSGAGKSTLAKELGNRYGCPILYLDRVNFEAGWKERNRDECRRIVTDFMKKDSWVIDGNYREFLQEQRLEEADKIILFDFPRRTCFPQAIKRFLGSRNRSRESMAEGCNEKFDLEFALWLLIKGRTRECLAHYRNICCQFREKVIVCKNRNDMQAILRDNVF